MPPLEAQEAEIWLERILRCSVPSCRTAHFLSIRVIEISGDLRIESKKKICYFFVAQILREIPRGRLFFTRKAPIQILSDCLYYQTLITLLYRISWGKSKNRSLHRGHHINAHTLALSSSSSRYESLSALCDCSVNEHANAKFRFRYPCKRRCSFFSRS